MNSNIYKLKFKKDLINNSDTFFRTDNTFTSFKSKDGILYLIYVSHIVLKHNTIVSYNLIDDKKLNEIRKAHNESISNIRNFFDKNSNIDLLLSISPYDSNIKIWNVTNFECLVNIIEIYENCIYSACILSDNKKIYVITGSNNNSNLNPDLIKVFDFKGNELQKIKNSKDNIVFIDIYYDNELSKNYIITGNEGYVKSFIFGDNILYYKYNDNSQKNHYSVIINNNKGIVQLIESSGDGNIRIWNFHTGELLSKILINKKRGLCGICLWNNEYLVVGCSNKSIKIVELNNTKIIKELNGHKGLILRKK